MRIIERARLRERNTLQISAQCAALVEVDSEVELQAAIEWCQQHKLNVIPLGEGSNVVFATQLNVALLRYCGKSIEILEDHADHLLVRVEAGHSWHDFVRWTLQQGCSGLENLALIPGTVGAAPIQNIGAYGVEVKDSIAQVHGISIADGKPFTLSQGKCEFAYRDSVFKQTLKDAVLITTVDFYLPRGVNVNTRYPALASYLAAQGIENALPQQVFDAVVAIRSSKLPAPEEVPNVGSFFKNPMIALERAAALQQRFPGLPSFVVDDMCAKVPAAWMIEHCGWKGRRNGDVGVHSEHALVLVNYGAGTGEQILDLASRIAADVAATFDVQLDIEPRLYGFTA